MNKILIGIIALLIVALLSALNQRNDLYSKNSQCMEVVEMYYDWSQK